MATSKDNLENTNKMNVDNNDLDIIMPTEEENTTILSPKEYVYVLIMIIPGLFSLRHGNFTNLLTIFQLSLLDTNNMI